MNEFSLHIDLGNESMSTREDVAWSLAQVMAHVHNGVNEGTIQDANGKTVGKFHLALPEACMDGTCTEVDMSLTA